MNMNLRVPMALAVVCAFALRLQYMFLYISFDKIIQFLILAKRGENLVGYQVFIPKRHVSPFFALGN